MTWNIEGLKRNAINLHHFLDLYSPDLVFLSEPQMFECDMGSVMDFYKDKYAYLLNSADRYDDCLPLRKSRANGGTCVLWKKEIDPFIKPHPMTTTSFCPTIL